MAISKINFTRAQGNLNSPAEGEDHISALVFDVSTYPANVVDGDAFALYSTKDAEALGIKPFSSEEGATNYENGIPHLHISEFFRINPRATLYIALADCSDDWDIIEQVQRLAQGKIRQLGVWTRQKMLAPGATASDPYSLRLIADINGKAEALADINQPISTLVSGNMASVDTSGETTNITLLPNIIANNQRATALIGQGDSDLVKAIQLAETNHASVGCVGAMLGLVSRSFVGESISWVQPFDMSGGNMSAVALGFGDVTVDNGKLANTYPMNTLSAGQIDALETKGFVFPMHYTDRQGTYASSSRTCASGDYNSIERNRVIDKALRGLRSVMLPFLNSPVKLAPSTGVLSAGVIKKYENACTNVLQAMVDNNEISGFGININPEQNILETETLYIPIVIVPLGKAANINITQGFAVTNQ